MHTLMGMGPSNHVFHVLEFRVMSGNVSPIESAKFTEGSGNPWALLYVWMLKALLLHY